MEIAARSVRGIELAAGLRDSQSNRLQRGSVQTEYLDRESAQLPAGRIII
jgi:hypothetical protein